MRLIYALLIPVAFLSCKSKTATNNTAQKVTLFEPDFKTTGPPAMVYKTKKDYNNLVPVILSDDKSMIVSYPAPSDIKVGDALQTPVALKNGYLLDNRGINGNVAFINMTYEAYSKLQQAPPVAELLAMITDKDPLLELCNCGNKTALTNAVEQLNTLIDSSKLRSTCQPIK